MRLPSTLERHPMITELKARIIVAMKAGNTQERNILKVVLGDLQSNETRKGTPLTVEECELTVRKIIKGVSETITLTADPAAKAALEAEKTIMETLLPKTATEAEITAALAPVTEAIRAAGNDGQATGVAMKQLKVAGLVVAGPMVAAVVKSLRA